MYVCIPKMFAFGHHYRYVCLISAFNSTIISTVKKIQTLVALIFILFSANSTNMYSKLDSVISVRNTYIQKRENRITKLKGQLKIENNAIGRYSVSEQLYLEYHQYMCDSAINYLNIALENAYQLKNDQLIASTKLNLVFLYTSSGVFEESISLLNSIDPTTLNLKLKLQYYITCESLYGELKRLANDKRDIRKYEQKRLLYEDSLIKIAPPKHERALKIRESYFLSHKLYAKALQINNYRISITPKDDPRFSIIAFDRFLIEREMHNSKGEKEYLILSAICDLKNAVRDNASLSSLANLLHSEGEIERAYKYIKVVQEDAAFYHARLRFIQVSTVMPIIEESFRIINEKQRRNIILSLMSISCLAVFLLLSLLMISKQKKKLSIAKDNLQLLNDKLIQLNEELRSLNHELSSVNQIKEVYIGQFLNICSVYIDKLDTMRRSVIKKLLTGKTSELQESLGSQEIIDKEIDEFYKNFDEVFLHIFPNFVDELNDLLFENERIEMKNGELLTVELRIFALIRLGITDSAKIAKLLRYSVNTIYNYRAKVKNKVKASRDGFESMIMGIGTYEL